MTDAERKAFLIERYRYYRRCWSDGDYRATAIAAYKNAKQDANRAEEWK